MRHPRVDLRAYWTILVMKRHVREPDWLANAHDAAHESDGYAISMPDRSLKSS